jgi:hypothetical protein
MKALKTGLVEPARNINTDANQPNTSSCRSHGNRGKNSEDVMLPTALQEKCGVK